MPKLDNTVVLHGIVTDLDSPEGRRFVVDCTRAGEGLIEDRELVEIYEISAKDWQAVTENRALANAIRDERAKALAQWRGCSRGCGQRICQGSSGARRNPE